MGAEMRDRLATVGDATTQRSSTATNDSRTQWILGRANDYNADADTLRKRTDLTASGLSALATAAVTAIGIAEAVHIFPLDTTRAWVAAAAVALAFVFMATAVIVFIARFWRANRPLFPTSDPEAMLRAEAIDPDEKRTIERIYEQEMRHVAFLSRDGETLENYEGRADTLERQLQTRWGQVGADETRRQIARMRAEIQAAQQRAKLVVVRGRWNRTLGSRSAVPWAVLLVVGLLAFFIAGDYLNSVHPRPPSSSVADP
jgi:hypothetical protein